MRVDVPPIALPHGERGLILTYGLAHYGKSLLWNLSSLLFLYFLTEMAGLAAVEAGVLLGLAVVVGALADIAIGYALRWRLAGFEDAARLQVHGTAAASLAMSLLAAGIWLPEAIRVVAIASMVVCFRLAYSYLDVTQNVYFALVARDDAQRARLSSVRYVTAALSLVTIGLGFAPLVMTSGAPGARVAFLLLAAGSAAAALSGAWLTREWARTALHGRAAPPLRAVPGHARQARHAYCALLGAIAAFTFCGQFFNKVEAHFSSFTVPGAIAPWVLLAAACGQLMAQPAWMTIGTRFGPVRLLQVAAAFWAGVIALSLWFPVVGASVLAMALLYRAGWSGIAVALWALLARFAVAPGLTAWRVGGFTFSAKLAEAAAMPLVGWSVGAAFYDDTPWTGDAVWALMTLPSLICASALLAAASVRTLMFRSARTAPSGMLQH